jgi:hypothetical protein
MEIDLKTLVLTGSVKDEEATFFLPFILSQPHDSTSLTQHISKEIITSSKTLGTALISSSSHSSSSYSSSFSSSSSSSSFSLSCTARRGRSGHVRRRKEREKEEREKEKKRQESEEVEGEGEIMELIEKEKERMMDELVRGGIIFDEKEEQAADDEPEPITVLCIRQLVSSKLNMASRGSVDPLVALSPFLDVSVSALLAVLEAEKVQPMDLAVYQFLLGVADVRGTEKMLPFPFANVTLKTKRVSKLHGLC